MCAWPWLSGFDWVWGFSHLPPHTGHEDYPGPGFDPAVQGELRGIVDVGIEV
jgi:hypothetical protein